MACYCICRYIEYDNNIFQVNHFLESLYYYYIKEWMTVFPRHQFLVIPFEVYMKNKTDIMNTVFNFLQLGK